MLINALITALIKTIFFLSDFDQIIFDISKTKKSHKCFFIGFRKLRNFFGTKTQFGNFFGGGGEVGWGGGVCMSLIETGPISGSEVLCKRGSKCITDQILDAK